MGTADRPGAAARRGPCAAIPAEQMDFVRQVLDRIGDKWSMLVIAVLETGPLRYTDLQREVPGISQRMLTLTVRQLQQDVTSLITWVADHHGQIREHRARTATAPGPRRTAPRS